MRFMIDKVWLWFKNRNQSKINITETDSPFKPELSQNPYLQSRALWNDLYGDLEGKYRRNQWVIFILLGVIVVMIVGLIGVAGETKIRSVPFIIHGNELITLTEQSSNQVDAIKPSMAVYFAKQFIQGARSVSVDGDVNRTRQIAAYSLVSGAAVQALKDYYAKTDPHEATLLQTKDIHITSVLPESSHTLSVRWQEETRDARSGTTQKTEQWIAEITYTYSNPSDNETILKSNPLGFYITHFSWTLDQNN